MNSLSDQFGRRIDYLRISVTDRCNLRCIYCMPGCGIMPFSPGQILSFEEIEKVVETAARLGIDKIRITGGEPLVRKGLIELIRKLSRNEFISDLSLTTNGTLLRDYAKELRMAGLKRINISLDTLDEEKYKYITGYRKLRETFQGIDMALEYGLSPVKVNMVVMRGINDDEIVDFVRLSYDRPLSVRFIEFMPVGSNFLWEEKKFMPASEIMHRCQNLSKLIPGDRPLGNGPAEYYRIKGGMGTVGFISALSEPFCSRCTRLRLTSDGKLMSCLYSEDRQLDLRAYLREGASIGELTDLIRLAILNKPKEHTCCSIKINHVMCQIGG